eukprot:7238972-Prymnesium_polylepis.1
MRQLRHSLVAGRLRHTPGDGGSRHALRETAATSQCAMGGGSQALLSTAAPTTLAFWRDHCRTRSPPSASDRRRLCRPWLPSKASHDHEWFGPLLTPESSFQPAAWPNASVPLGKKASTRAPMR